MWKKSPLPPLIRGDIRMMWGLYPAISGLFCFQDDKQPTPNIKITKSQSESSKISWQKRGETLKTSWFLIRFFYFLTSNQMKKILYAALWLFIFIFWWSQLLTQAANTSQSSDTFWVNSWCLWTFDSQSGSFVVESVNTTCTLENDSKDAWAKKYQEKNKKKLDYI